VDAGALGRDHLRAGGLRCGQARAAALGRAQVRAGASATSLPQRA